MSEPSSPFSPSSPADVVDSTEAAPRSVSWRTRALRRVAGSVGAAVVLAGVGPAIANAAGADLANPVAIALRASGKGLKTVFGSSDTQSVPCVSSTDDPFASPSGSASAEPTAEPTLAPTEEPTADPSVTASPTASPSDASASPSESASPTDAGTPSDTVETTLDPSVTPSVEPSVETSPDDCVETQETPSPSEEPESEDGAHGKLVSTVAHCAPKGKDPLLDVEGAPSNHGGYVRVAAHGESLTTPWGTFDLSTQAGADALCSALETARAELPEPTAAAKQSHGKKAKGEHGRPAKDKDKDEGGKGQGKHAGGDADDDAEDDDAEDDADGDADGDATE